MYGSGGGEEEDSEQKVITSTQQSHDINNNSNEREVALQSMSPLARTRQHLFNSTNNRNYMESLFPCGVFTSEELFRLSRGIPLPFD